jgi:RecJ-like exonuclease
MDGLEELCEGASEAASRLGGAIAGGSLISIVTHTDVDGISAGTIAFLAVRNQGGSAHLTFSGHVYPEDLSRLLSTDPEFLLFCDMGSDLLPELLDSDTDFLILDHHTTDNRDERLVNPSSAGGRWDISASGVVYIVVKFLNPKNIELSPLALCGAFGDMQTLTGANERIANDAESEGLVRRKKEIRLIGRRNMPIEYSLRYTTLPFIKGLSGNPEGIRSFLRETGIDVDPKTTICELDDEMERMLITSLVERMVKNNASTFEAEKLFGATLQVVSDDVPTIEDMVDYVESCGALGRYSTAFALLSGDPAILEWAERSRLEYKEKILEGVGLFESAVHLSSLDYMVLKGWDEYAGKLCGIYANAGFAGHHRPVFALSPDEGSIKVSARTNPQLVDRGLNLGRALNVVAGKFGGNGGGHSVAAGAKIPAEAMDDFVRELDREVGQQLAEEDVEV